MSSFTKLFAAVALAGLVSAPAALAAEAPAARIVRFNGVLKAVVKSRDPDGHFRPKGLLTVQADADALLNPGASNAYASVVNSNVDGKGGFIDNVVIHFPRGDLKLTGVYPTHNDITPIANVRHTVMIEKVAGGSGAFEGATGYVMLNSTMTETGEIEGSVNAIVFLAPVKP